MDHNKQRKYFHCPQSGCKYFGSNPTRHIRGVHKKRSEKLMKAYNETQTKVESSRRPRKCPLCGDIVIRLDNHLQSRKHEDLGKGSQAYYKALKEGRKYTKEQKRKSQEESSSEEELPDLHIKQSPSPESETSMSPIPSPERSTSPEQKTSRRPVSPSEDEDTLMYDPEAFPSAHSQDTTPIKEGPTRVEQMRFVRKKVVKKNREPLSDDPEDSDDDNRKEQSKQQSVPKRRKVTFFDDSR
jgi:hypothetical protein